MQKPHHDFEPIAILSMEGIASSAFLESVRMKLYDGLETPQTATQIATAFGMAEQVTEAFLDLLLARGLLVRADGRYANSPVAAEYLVSQSPFYQGDCITLHQKPGEAVARKMADLLHGEAKPGGDGAAMWSSVKTLAGSAQYSMRGGLQDTVEFVAALPGFMEMRTMCDLGGGHGRYATSLLDLNPAMEAVVMDLPGVVSAAESLHRQTDYGNRLSFAPCDLRSDRLPERSYDLILASHVLYPFSDRLQDVVAMIAQALKPGGWFVSHHLDPNGDACRCFCTAVDLTTCLLGKARHVLNPAKLEAALSHAGLTNFRTGTSGFHAENLIVAAQMTSVAER